MSDESAAIPRAPGKWSPKEVIGHLIDSATNNHGRFMRAQLTDGLHFEGYAQDDWVRVQRYHQADWYALIDLWQGLNLHLATIMEATPEAIRMRPRVEHNLETIAFITPGANDRVTLHYFMSDYVDHLKHHLRQVVPDHSTIA